MTDIDDIMKTIEKKYDLFLEKSAHYPNSLKFIKSLKLFHLRNKELLDYLSKNKNKKPDWYQGVGFHPELKDCPITDKAATFYMIMCAAYDKYGDELFELINKEKGCLEKRISCVITML